MTAGAEKLGLSVDQLGLDAAPAGARHRQALRDAHTVLRVAAEAGMSVLDANVATVEGETRLGAALPAPSPFKASVRIALGPRGAEGVEEQARASLDRLGLERGEALLAASAADLLGPDGAGFWRALQALKGEGRFDRVGVCATAEDDPVGIARRFKPDLMQLPLSLLDQRLVASGALSELAALGVDLHLRSALLQGALFLPGHGLPAPLAPAAARLSRVRRIIAEAGADLLQAALAYPLGRAEASAVLVGAASAGELRAIAAAAAAPPPVLDWDALALDSIIALDPQLWAAA